MPDPLKLSKQLSSSKISRFVERSTVDFGNERSLLAIPSRNAFRNATLCWMVSFALCCPLGLAMGAEPKVVIIHGAKFVTENHVDAAINVQLIDGIVNLLTRDPIPHKSFSEVIDASSGYLIGRVMPGEKAHFIIVDEDPVADFEVLLDTRSHILLAVDKGTIVVNRLASEIQAPPPKSEETTSPVDIVSKWFAYSSPPVALPGTWDEGRKWNHWDTDFWTGIFSGDLILDRTFWLSQNAPSKEQVGDLKAFESGEIRGYRFGIFGSLKFDQPWTYGVFVASNAFSKGFDSEGDVDGLTFLDYSVDIPTFGGTTLSVGKQKEPYSIEQITSGANLPGGIDRSAPNASMMRSRSLGVIWSGNALVQSMSWAVGGFNNSLDTGKSFSDSSSEFIGRATALPWISEDENSLIHLGVGIRRSDEKEGVRYQTKPELNNAPLFVDTGPERITASDSLGWNFETLLMHGSYMLQGQYLNSRVDSVGNGKLDFSGYNFVGSWVLTGEKQSYNKRNGTLTGIPIARGIDTGGWGALQVSARYTNLDLTDGPIDGGEMRIRSLGLNWWLRDDLYIGAFYREINLERGGLTGKSSGFMTRVGLILK